LDAVLSARPIYARLECGRAGWCNAVLSSSEQETQAGLFFCGLFSTFKLCDLL